MRSLVFIDLFSQVYYDVRIAITKVYYIVVDIMYNATHKKFIQPHQQRFILNESEKYLDFKSKIIPKYKLLDFEPEKPPPL